MSDYSDMSDDDCKKYKEISSQPPYLKNCAEFINDQLPDGHGFVLLTFPFNGQGTNHGQLISNCTPKAALMVLDDWRNVEEG